MDVFEDGDGDGQGWLEINGLFDSGDGFPLI